jgi:hypothetical protein
MAPARTAPPLAPLGVPQPTAPAFDAPQPMVKAPAVPTSAFETSSIGWQTKPAVKAKTQAAAAPKITPVTTIAKAEPDDLIQAAIKADITRAN